MFSTLDPSIESRKRRAVAFSCAMSFQALLIGATVLLGVLYPDELPVPDRHYALTWLLALVPPEESALQLPREVARLPVPKIPSPEPPKLRLPPAPVHEVPEIRPTTPPASAYIPEPPLPAAPVAQPTPPAKAKEQIEVHTGLFGGAVEPVTTKRPLQQVQTGGFGSPEGLPGRAQGENPGNVPKLGSFELPAGPGVGNGTGGHRGIQGVVASAGFGSGIAGTGNGREAEGPKVTMGGFDTSVGNAPKGAGTEGPKVTMGGFEKAAQATPPPPNNLKATPPVQFQPIEILSKPSPAYTEEARQLRIQGEVALAVVFQASGAIRVISVVKSLGHGLDQAAEKAALQIRFKPAQRDGKATDFPATLRIEFRLADQST
jgi:TonB family protein